jgi:hypothetical protein
MKLYHATDRENLESITEVGLFPGDGGTKVRDKTRDTIQGSGLIGVFGFTSLEEAINFAIDNNYDGLIYEFDSSDYDTIDDPEYDDVAKFVITSTPIAAKLIFEQWA